MADLEDIGRYKVLREIGKGGMARVFLAFDPQLQCNVALKVLAQHPNPKIQECLKSLFAKEAQVLAQLNHPNVVRVFDLNLSEENPYISMEYVEGLNLSQFLRKNSHLSLTEHVKIFAEICKGVAAIHSKGVVHRDLKPDNVMISNSGDVKVMDFGIVEDFRNEDNFIVGTPAFMAPEQIKSGHVDIQSDIFSLGIIGAILFSGKNPFHASSLEKVREKQQKQPISFPESLTGPLKKLLESCLQLNPRNRPADVNSIIRSLESAELETPKNSFLKSSSAAKFLVFSMLIFAGSRLFLRFKDHHSLASINGSIEYDLSDYYSTIEKCYPNCEGSSQSLTKTLDSFFPSLKCGDGMCSYLEKTCALCTEDCGSGEVRNWKMSPACITFSTPAPSDTNAKEARTHFDNCAFSLKFTKDSSPQSFVSSLVSCVRRFDNPVIKACSKEQLADNKDFGSAATKFSVCILKGRRNF